jgi:hypothetical protein
MLRVLHPGSLRHAGRANTPANRANAAQGRQSVEATKEWRNLQEDWRVPQGAAFSVRLFWKHHRIGTVVAREAQKPKDDPGMEVRRIYEKTQIGSN